MEQVWRPFCVYSGDVECWIGIFQESKGHVVRVAGQLTITHVPELLKVCAVPGPLQIELTDLVSADMAGIEALQRVRAAGAVLVGVPGYIRLKLDTAGAAVTPTRKPPRPK